MNEYKNCIHIFASQAYLKQQKENMWMENLKK